MSTDPDQCQRSMFQEPPDHNEGRAVVQWSQDCQQFNHFNRNKWNNIYKTVQNRRTSAIFSVSHVCSPPPPAPDPPSLAGGADVSGCNQDARSRWCLLEELSVEFYIKYLRRKSEEKSRPSTDTRTNQLWRFEPLVLMVAGGRSHLYCR